MGDPAIKWDDESTSLMSNVVDSFIEAGKNVKHGHKFSAAFMYDTAANIPWLINEANDYLAEKTGVGQPSEKT